MSLMLVKQLSFGFGKQFFEPFDFELNEGEVVALLGPNGTGKSTFLKICSGELSAMSGHVEVVGANVCTLPAMERAKRIARVRPTIAVPERMTVEEFVMLGRSSFAGVFDSRGSNDIKVVEDSLRTADAMQFAKRLLCSLSDGERARVFLAEALARETSVLLLDEPTAFLDVPHTISLFKLLKQIATDSKCGIVICTHQVEYALRFATRVLVFEQGRNVFAGTALDAENSGALEWAKVRE